MKKNYIEPSIDVVCLTSGDIMNASGIVDDVADDIFAPLSQEL